MDISGPAISGAPFEVVVFYVTLNAPAVTASR